MKTAYRSTAGLWIRRWLAQVADPIWVIRGITGYLSYFADWWRYIRLPRSEPIRLLDTYPQVHDRISRHTFDPHYFYQAIWAMERITQNRAKHHIDVGSDVRFVTMLTTHLPVTFVDIRPLEAEGIEHLVSMAGSILELPFADASVESLSCLHVAEHIGLGRYADPLDPSGTRRACAELARVLAPGGNLFFSLPVGRSRVCFNAHRVHSPRQILDYFRDLDLAEFVAVDDHGNLLHNLQPNQMAVAEYGCGLFWFQRNLDVT